MVELGGVLVYTRVGGVYHFPGTSVFTYLYLSAMAPALGEAKGLFLGIGYIIQFLIIMITS